MPDLITHHHQVEHNRAVMVYLEQAGVEHLDWVVTVMFYMAMHLVDQVLFQHHKLNPRNHHQRHAAIANEAELAPAYADYRELEHQSRQSRYECVTFSKSEVDRLAVRLARIEQTVNTIIQPAPRQQQSE